jgi:lipoprotein NlpD
MRRAAAFVLFALLLGGCAARRAAPDDERLPLETAPPPGADAPNVEAPPPAPVEKPIPTHTVKRGETLVGIALQYGLDYRELAAWNNIVNPNVLAVGQELVVAAPAGAQPLAAPMTTPLVSAGPPIEARPLANTPALKVEPRGVKVPYSDRAYAQLASPESGAPPPPPSVEPPPVAPRPTVPEPEKPGGTDREDVDWMWPVKGKVIQPFSELTKGTDIGGRKGTPIVAAASGKVIYAGDGVRGYGKLVIIKHNNVWVSAYAHNDKLLVEDRQEVRKGQKIAEMGQSDTDQVKLHFELRREGKPVDPARILPGM